MNVKYIYSGKASQVESADGVSGMLIKVFGGGYLFRVSHRNGDFTDYTLRHDDLSITIDSDALASFYSSGDCHTLDHSPNVLGLSKAEE